ncbi:hypothetical protein B4U80_12638 [Leptotrombidium deliense]|uniref:Uncharacterized protein n=1 Tax=Leptotrombidium deliense TaxID=299467 RepID=A0A443SS58_9ACAR|nr:hypothetical protein B4U80_12638 [Leptotrombidium deliense]
MNSTRSGNRTVVVDTGDGGTVCGRLSNSSVVYCFYREIIELELAKKNTVWSEIWKAFKERWHHKQDKEKHFKGEINLAVQDRLIRLSSNKYSIDRARRCQNNDFYCFRCCKSGKDELIKCSYCWRVYHVNCFHYSDIRGRCFFCKDYSQESIRGKIITKKQLNDVLAILYRKLKSEYQSVVNVSNFADERSELKELVANFVFIYDITFDSVEKKIKSQGYESVLQFVFDCKQITFLFRVLYGDDSTIVKQSLKMENLVLSEEHFIHNCAECYMHYGNKSEYNNNCDWFLIPCDPPHEVCFAQVEGFPHYPAKVMRRDDEKTFVWFFDEARATAEPFNQFIRPRLPKNTPIDEKLQKALSEYSLYLKACREILGEDTESHSSDAVSK